MGSFDKIKNLLNEVTLKPRSKFHPEEIKKRSAERANKMKGMLAVEEPGSTDVPYSKKKGLRGKNMDVNASTEILTVLKSLKEGYESGLITEAAFLKLAQPILEKFGSASDVRNNPPGSNPKKKNSNKAPWGGKGPKKSKKKWKENKGTSFGSQADKG